MKWNLNLTLVSIGKRYSTVKTPRDKSGLASGKPETYYRTQSSGWATEEIFVKYYQKIREK